MADIQKLIQDLQSEDPETRFNACNGLFYEISLPESALEALRVATQDSDQNVANAAQSALDIHSSESTFPSYSPFSSSYTTMDEEEFEEILDDEPGPPASGRIKSAEYAKTRQNRLRLSTISATIAAVVSALSNFVILSNSAGYAEASIQTSLAPIFLLVISLGAGIVAAFVAIAIASRLFGNTKIEYILLIGAAMGLVLGILSGYFCNLWQ
ncbi:MAG: hypothetical protein JSV42_10930 [Chloroflexota bacterium]|nr:MAG: hypothetical protein JSV42_10930 [Chloroflexota bacterium]